MLQGLAHGGPVALVVAAGSSVEELPQGRRSGPVEKSEDLDSETERRHDLWVTLAPHPSAS